MATPVAIGPFGGPQGKYRDLGNDSPQNLVSITVNRSKDGKGGQITGLKFSYVDGNGDVAHSPQWGTPSGSGTPMVNIEPGEFVSEVKGTADRNVRSLTIVKSTGEEKVFGDTETGKEFDIPLDKGIIVGFIARADTVINAVGVYVGPQPI